MDDPLACKSVKEIFRIVSGNIGAINYYNK